jgi:hypothetical protein
MKAYKLNNNYVITELTTEETEIINDILSKSERPVLEDWGGTEYTLLYDRENNLIELWDGKNYECDLIEPKEVEII